MASSRSRRSSGSSSETFSSSSIGANLRSAKAAASALYLRPRSAEEGFSAMSAMNPIASPDPASNVVAVGIGEKVSKGISTGIPAVKVFVRVKFGDSDISDDDRIQDMIDGMPVDVEQIGTIRAFAAMPNPRVKIRPAPPGSSVGFLNPNFKMAGTFGALAKKGNKVFVLSNNHVLADENRLPLGSPIVQPGPLDGGKPSNNIARLTKFIPLVPTGNVVDAAIAEADPKQVTRDILFIGPPKGKTPAKIDMTVHKFGRTTSYRVGRVISIDTDVKIAYDIGELMFENQIVIRGINGEQFSAAGDSGSLILERSTNKATGLLFAGSSSHTIANHIDDVLKALKITLA
jgi:hypothetical protein